MSRFSFRSLPRLYAVVFAFSPLFPAASVSLAQEGSEPLPEGPYLQQEALSLEDFMQRVVRFNESIQGRLLGFQAARRQRMAELGDFEPTLVVSGEYVDRRQANNFQIERQLGLLTGGQANGYPSIFKERNSNYTSAIELLTPLGTRLRLGATGRELSNNIPRPQEFLNIDKEYEVNAGISLEQPLLKGMGFAANMASLRLAARQSEIAFQEYRGEFMQIVAQAEMAYWELYYAQQALELSRESVALAQTLFNDSDASFEAGRGSRLDVLEAEAGLALRQSREREAFQRRVEALNQLAAFFSGLPRESQTDFIASDAPVSQPVEMSFESGLRTAMAMNPDLLRAQLRGEQERIRMGYARNQKLPEVNLTASFGSSGLGFDWESAYNDVENDRFPDWKFGLVVRLPIWGNNRGKNEYRAARLRVRQAESAEANLITQLRVGRDSSEQRVESTYTTARSLEAVVQFRANLLETRMESRDIGRMDARSVLEAEQELFAARLEQLQSEVEFQRALLELQLVSGSLLQLRGLEISYEDLEDQTRRWIRDQPEGEFGMVYEPAQIAFLPAADPVPFEGERVPAPWFGINWGNWDGEPFWEAVFDDEYENRKPLSPKRQYPRRQ